MKLKYFLIGILGIGIIAIIILIVLLWPLSRGPGVSPDAKAKADMAQIQAKAELMKIADKSYNNLSCAYDNIMIRLCEDIEKRVGMKPTIFATKDKYCAYIKLNIEGYYCMDSKGVRRETDINPSGLGYCDGRTFICPSE